MRAMDELPRIERLPWDSAFFGFPVARFISDRLDTAVSARILEQCRQELIRCLYFLTPANSSATIFKAQELGMRFTDIRLTLEWRGEIPADWQDPSPVQMRRATAADQIQLPRFAPQLAAVSRFSRDPGFGRQKAVEMYEIWLAQTADLVLVAVENAALLGVITGNIQADGLGVIPLLAVDPRMQGKGVATALCRAGLNWFVAQGCRRVQVVTQGLNIFNNSHIMPFGKR